MVSSSTLEERERFMRWLRYGAQLAQERHGERATHGNVVWLLLADAVDMIDRTPDQERRWLTSGTRSGGWNMIGMTPFEALDIERIRLLSAMKPADGATGYQPQRTDHIRALDVLGWLRFCNDAREPQRLQKAAIELARGGDTAAVHRLYAPGRKPSRQTAYEIKTRTTGFILRGLREQHGIVPWDDLTFVETP